MWPTVFRLNAISMSVSVFQVSSFKMCASLKDPTLSEIKLGWDSTSMGICFVPSVCSFQDLFKVVSAL